MPGAKLTRGLFSSPFRHNIIGYQQRFETPFGRKDLITPTGPQRKTYDLSKQRSGMMCKPGCYYGQTPTGNDHYGTDDVRRYEQAKTTVNPRQCDEDYVLVFLWQRDDGCSQQLQRIWAQAA